LLLLLLAARPAQAETLAALKVMPLGDSITSGTDAWASYRCLLYRDLVARGYNVDFIGSIHGQLRDDQPPPEECRDNFDWDHEGHSGYRVDDILPLLPGWLSANRPDIVLLHLGTVDFISGESGDSTLSGISQVIDQLRAANPRVKILLAQIVPARWAGTAYDAAIAEYNARLPALAASKAQPYSPILIVDQFTGFDPASGSDTHDGVHPNASGEQKIAARWRPAFEQIVKIEHWQFLPMITQLRTSPRPSPEGKGGKSDLPPFPSGEGRGEVLH
jgi:lysophospholipase L1-like esterase